MHLPYKYFCWTKFIQNVWNDRNIVFYIYIFCVVDVNSKCIKPWFLLVNVVLHICSVSNSYFIWFFFDWRFCWFLLNTLRLHQFFAWIFCTLERKLVIILRHNFYKEFHLKYSAFCGPISIYWSLNLRFMWLINNFSMRFQLLLILCKPCAYVYLVHT